MQIDFEKWHGLGNDFVVVWVDPSDKNTVSSLLKNAPLICKRDHGHVGADGILVCAAGKSEIFPRSIQIINSDGSVAKNCGNGLRCVMGSVWRRSVQLNTMIEQDSVVELTVEGNTFFGRYLRALPKEFLNPVLKQISISMPPPVSAKWCNEFRDFSSKVSDQVKVLNCFSIGNPHAVVEWSGERGNLFSIASKLQEFECEGSDGINLHVISEHIPDTKNTLSGMSEHGHKEVWVWERGVGPTKACGSGACAVGAHAYTELEADYGSWVEIKMPGGLLWVRQISSSDEIELMGPAEMTFAGEFYL